MSLRKIAVLASIVGIGYTCYRAGRRWLNGEARTWTITIERSARVPFPYHETPGEDSHKGQSPWPSSPHFQSKTGIEEVVTRRLVQHAERLWGLARQPAVEITDEQLAEAWDDVGVLHSAEPAMPFCRRHIAYLSDGTRVVNLLVRMAQDRDVLCLTIRYAPQRVWTEEQPVPTVAVTVGNQQLEGLEAAAAIQLAEVYVEQALANGPPYHSPSILMADMKPVYAAMDAGQKTELILLACRITDRITNFGSSEPESVMVNALRDIDANASLPQQDWSKPLSRQLYDPAMFSEIWLTPDDRESSHGYMSIVPYMLPKPVVICYPMALLDLVAEQETVDEQHYQLIDWIVVMYGGVAVSAEKTLSVLRYLDDELTSRRSDDWAGAPIPRRQGETVEFLAGEREFLKDTIAFFVEMSQAHGRELSHAQFLQLVENKELPEGMEPAQVYYTQETTLRIYVPDIYGTALMYQGPDSTRSLRESLDAGFWGFFEVDGTGVDIAAGAEHADKALREYWGEESEDDPVLKRHRWKNYPPR